MGGEPLHDLRDHDVSVLLVRRIVGGVPLHDQPLGLTRCSVESLGMVGRGDGVVLHGDDHEGPGSDRGDHVDGLVREDRVGGPELDRGGGP